MEIIPHPMSQGCRNDIRLTTDDVMRRFWSKLNRDLWRHLVFPTLPTFVEMEDNESPPDSVVDDAANDFLPGQVVREAKADHST